MLFCGLDAAPRLNRRQIVEAAKLGELVGPDGRQLERFDVNVSTVAKYLQAEKRRRLQLRPKTSRDQENDVDRAAAARREAWAIVEKDLRRIKTLPGGRGEKGQADAERIAKRETALGAVLKNVEQLQKLAEPRRRAERQQAPAEHAERPESPNPTAELERAARTQPPALERTGPTKPVRVEGRLQPLPTVRAVQP